METSRSNMWAIAALSAVWLGFQIFIIFEPQVPLVQRPLHLFLAIVILFLARPAFNAPTDRLPLLGRLLDVLLLAAAIGVLGYYLVEGDRLTGRMEGVEPVFMHDMVFGSLLILLVLEASRRAVGWMLVSVLLVFLLYGYLGGWFPGWLRFGGFSIAEATENFTMTANGILGVTTATSLTFVYYFVMFGAVYSAIGGGQLFIDIGLRLTGRFTGGAAKSAILASSAMGSISGSAVANVATTGLFTIPLMRQSGYRPSSAAAVEAIASTGGQLMPPIMGVAAFVMAELLQMPYQRIALAAIIPAVAFYCAIFLIVDLMSRKAGLGRLKSSELAGIEPILPRLYLLAPPAVLVGMLVAGFSATFSAVIATASCIVACYVRRASWMSGGDWMRALTDGTKQVADVAVPIAAIGIIIEVAIQSNLALKFSTGLIGLSGGTLFGAMVWIVVGCLIMGMGLPTVAAYIIGAILFVPALKSLGIAELPAHFFVMYFCVLSMITPPVALASFTAAGLARASIVSTSVKAFGLATVSFILPFAFAFEPALLGTGSPGTIALACAGLALGTVGWAVALAGFVRWSLPLWIRIPLGAVSAFFIVIPMSTPLWTAIAIAVFGLLAVAALVPVKAANKGESKP